MNKIENYINGELIAPVDNNYIDNFNPATGKVYSLIPDSNIKDVELAVEAANAASAAWGKTPKEERSRILVSISTKITEQLDAFALAESIDNGKPLKLAKTVACYDSNDKWSLLYRLLFRIGPAHAKRVKFKLTELRSGLTELAPKPQ